MLLLAVKDKNITGTGKRGSMPGDLQVTFVSDRARNPCWAHLSYVTFMSHARVFLIELTHVREVRHCWILWKWKRWMCVCSISLWRKWKRKQSQPNQNQVTLLSRPRLTFTAFLGSTFTLYSRAGPLSYALPHNWFASAPKSTHKATPDFTRFLFKEKRWHRQQETVVIYHSQFQEYSLEKKIEFFLEPWYV